MAAGRAGKVPHTGGWAVRAACAAHYALATTLAFAATAALATTLSTAANLALTPPLPSPPPPSPPSPAPPRMEKLLACSSDRPGWATNRELYVPEAFLRAASTSGVRPR